MSFDYKIYKFYKEIYDEIYDGLFDNTYESEENILNGPFDLKKELNEIINKPSCVTFDSKLTKIANSLHKILSDFIRDNYYRLYYNYAANKINTIINSDYYYFEEKYQKQNYGLDIAFLILLQNKENLIYGKELSLQD